MSKCYREEDLQRALIGFVRETGIDEKPYDYAVNVLDNLPTIEVSEDAISREWAIKQQREMIDLLASHKTVEGREHVYWQIGERELVAKELMDAPSVVPTTEKSSMVGEWIISEPIESGFGTIFECSYCGEVDFQPTNYCHNCGARMKGAE